MVNTIRREYPDLLGKLEDELSKEICSSGLAKLDHKFMEEVITVRPSHLTQPEIDTRVEIIALRVRKILHLKGVIPCQ